MELGAGWQQRFLQWHESEVTAEARPAMASGCGSVRRELTRPDAHGEANRRAEGRVASSWQQRPDELGQRRCTASTWRARPDGGRPRRPEPETL